MNWRRRVASVVSIGAATAAVLLAPAPLAVAQDAGTRSEAAVQEAEARQTVLQTFRNRRTGLCMDDSVAYGLRSAPCNGLSYQAWYVRVWDDNTRQLRNQNTGGCIMDSSGIGIGIAACSSSRAMSWIISRTSQGIVFVNQSTNRCIHDYGGRLQTTSCIPQTVQDPAQAWY